MFTTTANVLSTMTDIPTHSNDLHHIHRTIIAVPVQDGDLIRAIPVAILNAAQGVSEGAALAMRAMNRKVSGWRYEKEVTNDDDKGKASLTCYDDFRDSDESENDMAGL